MVNPDTPRNLPWKVQGRLRTGGSKNELKKKKLNARYLAYFLRYRKSESTLPRYFFSRNNFYFIQFFHILPPSWSDWTSKILKWPENLKKHKSGSVTQPRDPIFLKFAVYMCQMGRKPSWNFQKDWRSNNRKTAKVEEILKFFQVPDKKKFSGLSSNSPWLTLIPQGIYPENFRGGYGPGARKMN